jgi:hypothetical protein
VRSWSAVAFVLVATLAVTTRGAHASASQPPPLIGVNYSHYRQLAPCSLDYTGIVEFGNQRAIRRAVKRQLKVMHSRGIQTLRLILWHMTDASGQEWGIVPSAGGHLAAPYRGNFVYYLTQVRRAGFRRLTLSLGPEWTNNPLSYLQDGSDNYDPSTFEENWNFLRDARQLARRYGPRSIHIDLINEGMAGPYDSQQAITYSMGYVRKLYTRYVDTFGNADVSVSLVGGSSLADNLGRLQNLIDVLRSTGRPLPHWFELHPSYDAGEALTYLRAADELLTRNGLDQPLILSEVAYNDRAEAAAIATFIRTSSRRVDEVVEWPLQASHPCKDVSVSPPYRADAYIQALR